MKIIGKPFTPSTIEGVEEIKMKCLVMSCGGGMGGSYREEFTKDDFDLNQRFITINTNTNKSAQLNTNFIVKVTNVKIVKLTIKNNGNINVGHKIGETKDYYYCFNEFEDVTIDRNKYVSSSDLKKIEFTY